MLHEQTIAHIHGLSDGDLLAYVLTGTRMYEPEAIAFAQAELERRAVPPERLAALRAMIIPQLAEYDAHASIDAVAAPKNAILCQQCGFEVPTAYVEYKQNIGGLHMRFSQRYRGSLCKRCSRKLFWRTSFVTAIAGWWGFPSFFMTPVVLMENFFAYLRTVPLAWPAKGAGPPHYDDAAVSKIAPHVPTITMRLNAGDDAADVARSVAPMAGVTPGQVLLFVRDVMNQPLADQIRENSTIGP